MLTHAQIAAENTSPAITEQQKLTLLMLVRQYRPYQSSYGRWPLLEDKIDAEIDTPTVKTQALKAVLTALGALPSIVVESEGSTDSPALFTTRANWDELARDVLNALYDVPLILGPQSVGVVNRPTHTMTIKDRQTFTEDETGRRY